jgi:hypothetical protein
MVFDPAASVAIEGETEVRCADPWKMTAREGICGAKRRLSASERAGLYSISVPDDPEGHEGSRKSD